MHTNVVGWELMVIVDMEDFKVGRRRHVCIAASICVENFEELTTAAVVLK